MIQKIKASIIGASGYVGLELIRLLSLHPNVEILYIFSRDEKDDISFKYPHLANIEIGENCSNIDIIAKDSDVVFLSLPHGEAEIYATELLGKVRVIDLSSDFRIKDKQLFKKYYENSHNQTITDKFVYGFIGKNFNDIKTTECIANPGCFAICMQMTMLPFIDNIKKINIIGITGSSGGGKQATDKNHHSVRSKNISSYNIGSHRHNAEVYQSFENLSDSNFTFVPSSGPFVRGIFMTAFIELKEDFDYNIENYYVNDKFFRVKKSINLNDVVGSNFFDISVFQKDKNNIVVQSAIDNLIKGASGNAIQCMNLIFNLDQNIGLSNVIPIYI